VISLVKGAAAGAGISFMLASDFVFAAEDTTLVFAQTRLGLPFDLGISYFLPRVVGAKKARQLAFKGARLNAEEARALGIVDEIHPAGSLHDALAGLIREFAAVAPRATARSKTLVNLSDRNSLLEQMELEVQGVAASVCEPDFAEGVAAFLEKRKAAFTGKAS
jgi:2-(1,2-epoxy-1,2-dihydrophenyl)acetyl-CoA isomerase